MKVPFELEWMGGPAEHHFRKVRPDAEALAWGTLAASDYAPQAVEYARGAWTEVAINEYRAVGSFCEVLRALVDVKAPLDLLGMTSDFLADECAHVELASRMAMDLGPYTIRRPSSCSRVELASRMAMDLGGAAPRTVDMDRFAPRLGGGSALQRANEVVLRVSCVAEAFSGGTASVAFGETSHPLPRSVYETILRDEARHRRLGGLYFEWALARIDDRERQRLGQVLLGALKGLAAFWKVRPRQPTPWPEDDLRALGWLSPPAFAPVARDVVVRDILDPLSTIGIVISPEERAELLG